MIYHTVRWSMDGARWSLLARICGNEEEAERLAEILDLEFILEGKLHHQAFPAVQTEAELLEDMSAPCPDPDLEMEVKELLKNLY